MNTKLIHHSGIHKALPTCYTYWQKIIGRLSSTGVTHVAMGTAALSVTQGFTSLGVYIKKFLHGGSLLPHSQQHKVWGPMLPKVLHSAVVSYQGFCQGNAREMSKAQNLGNIQTQGPSKCWLLQLTGTDKLQPTCWDTDHDHSLNWEPTAPAINVFDCTILKSARVTAKVSCLLQKSFPT